jgi:signal transduction histidine kinase
VLRAALVPTALVAAAAMLLPTGTVRRSAALAPIALVLAISVVAGSGRFRFAVAGIGATTVVAAIAHAGLLEHARSRRTAFGIGAAFMVVGGLTATSATTPWFVANLFELVMLASTIAVVWQAFRFADLRRVAALSASDDAGLGATIGDAFDSGPLQLTFPDGAGGWLDAVGAPCPRPAGGRAVAASDGAAGDVAWITPWIALDDRVEPSLRRLLAAIGDTARLRSRMRERAEEIAESRQRLESAAELERARLVRLIESGPLTTLRTARGLIDRTSVDGALHDRLVAADRALAGVVSGLDPIARSGGLEPAIVRLAAGAGATLTIEPFGDVPAEVARAIWFTCAEALANAAKHAPGFKVTVRLSCRGDVYELTVADSGAGGADPSGSGLAGLRERAEAVGAVLTVESPAGGGTTIRLRGDTTRDIPCGHVLHLASAPISPAIDTRTITP